MSQEDLIILNQNSGAENYNILLNVADDKLVKLKRELVTSHFPKFLPAFEIQNQIEMLDSQKTQLPRDESYDFKISQIESALTQLVSIQHQMYAEAGVDILNPGNSSEYLDYLAATKGIDRRFLKTLPPSEEEIKQN
ncbi:MAG: hypothetical protein V4469_04240 [Patescibacteria group bacterium]